MFTQALATLHCGGGMPWGTYGEEEAQIPGQLGDRFPFEMKDRKAPWVGASRSWKEDPLWAWVLDRKGPSARRPLGLPWLGQRWASEV